jgi:hypothetical protein
MRNAYSSLVGKHERKTPLGRTRRRWEGNTKRILGKYGGNIWTGYIWLRMGTSGMLL